MIFWKDEVAQNNGDSFGYLQIYYISTWMSSLKTWFVVGILKFQKWFDVFWAFKLSFVVDILAFFDQETFWSTFQKLGQFFFEPSGQPEWYAHTKLSKLY